jgi:hypothetical protein
MFVVVL